MSSSFRREYDLQWLRRYRQGAAGAEIQTHPSDAPNWHFRPEQSLRFELGSALENSS